MNDYKIKDKYDKFFYRFLVLNLLNFIQMINNSRFSVLIRYKKK